MSVEESYREGRAGFKDEVLAKLLVNCNESASTFDNAHREGTREIAEDVGAAYSLLLSAYKAYEKNAAQKHLWFAIWPAWQGLNMLVGAYHSTRTGFPQEAFVILRHSVENHAIAAALILHPELLADYTAGRLSGADRMGDLEMLYSATGREYGVIEECIAQPVEALREIKRGKSAPAAAKGSPVGTAGIVQSDAARMTVALCGLNSLYLHATAEIIAMSLIKDPVFWHKEARKDELTWHPKGAAQTRHSRRIAEFLKFYFERLSQPSAESFKANLRDALRATQIASMPSR